MTPRQQKAVVILGAALVGTYVLGNVAKGQARVLGLNAAQLAARECLINGVTRSDRVGR